MTGLEIALILVGVCFVFGSFMLAEKLTPGELEQLSRLSKDELNKIVEKTFKDAQDRIDETIDERIDENAEKMERKLEEDSNYAIKSISEYVDEVTKSLHDTHTEVTFLYSMMADKEDELKKSVSNAMVLAQKLNKLTASAAPEKPAQNTASVSASSASAAPVAKSPAQSAPAAPTAAPAAAQKERTTPASESNSSSEPVLNEPSVKPFEPSAAASPAVPSSSAKKAPETTESEKPISNARSEDTKEAFEPDVDPKTGMVYSAADRILERSNSNDEIISRHRMGMSVTDIAREMNLGKGQVQLVLDLFEGGQ